MKDDDSYCRLDRTALHEYSKPYKRTFIASDLILAAGRHDLKRIETLAEHGIWKMYLGRLEKERSVNRET